ncbi:RNA recognition motif-containing protein [Mucilaginibacter gracilis]|uniref:RNA recognition motif-containing protein n=1 Tax=Mucilaginibacter gracilis TaxID=423350 RepID=A0A495J4M1_9SPHI|nr:RNA-binding protein [Mucilaginibacter gracilis]RKR83284.1 RNA recognition motif-containing protein [Mucilaginibacter gracilis]
MAKLFIVGFPKDMQEIELMEIFSIHGAVNTVTVITDKDTGESKGYGFITMTDDAGASRAITALDGVEIDGRTMSVRFAEEKNATKPVEQNTLKKDYSRQQSRPDAPRPKRPRRA